MFQGRFMFYGRAPSLWQPSTWWDWWRVTKLFCTLFSLGLCLYDIAANSFTWYWVQLLLHCVYVFDLNNAIRKRSISAATILPRMLPCVALTMLILVLYALVGEVLMRDTDVTGAVALRESGNFDDVGESLVSLYYMFTANSQPDNMQSGFRLSEWWALYFDSFNLLMVWACGGLVMGVAYNEYCDVLKQHADEVYQAKLKRVHQAFHVLGYGEEQRLEFEQFVPLLQAVLGSGDPLTRKEAESVFKGLDRRRLHYLTDEGLLVVGDMRRYEPAPLPVFPQLAGILEGHIYSCVVDAFVIIEFVVVLVVVIQSSDGTNTGHHVNRFLILILATIEAIIKIVALGPWTYFQHRSGWIHLELGICVLAWAGFWATAFGINGNHNTAQHHWDLASFEQAADVAGVALCLRLVQVAYRIPQCRDVINALGECSRDLRDLSIVLLGTLFAFSSIGVGLFGGLVYSSNPSFGGNQTALDMDADGDIYLIINFNTQAIGVNSLIQLMVGNNWNAFVATATLATDQATSRAFYFTTMAVLTFVFLNIVVAFFVDAYSAAVRRNAEDAHAMNTCLGRIHTRVAEMVESGYAVKALPCGGIRPEKDPDSEFVLLYDEEEVDESIKALVNMRNSDHMGRICRVLARMLDGTQGCLRVWVAKVIHSRASTAIQAMMGDKLARVHNQAKQGAVKMLMRFASARTAKTAAFRLHQWHLNCMESSNGNASSHSNASRDVGLGFKNMIRILKKMLHRSIHALLSQWHVNAASALATAALYLLMKNRQLRVVSVGFHIVASVMNRLLFACTRGALFHWYVHAVSNPQPPRAAAFASRLGGTPTDHQGSVLPLACCGTRGNATW